MVVTEGVTFTRLLRKENLAQFDAFFIVLVPLRRAQLDLFLRVAAHTRVKVARQEIRYSAMGIV